MTDPQNWAAPGAQQPGAQPPGAQPPGPVPPYLQGQAGPQHPGFHPPGPPHQAPPGVPPGMPPAMPPWGGAPAAAPKPGVIPLRPLGLGEILDGAISYIRANPVATLGLAAIVITITQLIQLPASAFAVNRLTGLATTPDGQVAPEAAFGAIAGSFSSVALGGLVSFIATTVLSGLLIAVLGQAVLGRRMSIGEAWAAVRRRIPGLIGLTLLTTLLLGLVFVVAFVPMLITVVAGAPGAVVGILAVLFVLAAIGAVVYLGVSWSLAAPAYVLEGIGVTDALRRSFRLVRKQWWRVFGILLLGGLIAMTISFILSLPFTFAAGAVGGSSVLGDPLAEMSVLGLVVTAVGTIIATTVTAPFSAGISGLLYLDQRIRREALDIELARAAQQ